MTPSHVTEPVSTELGAKANRHLWGGHGRKGTRRGEFDAIYDVLQGVLSEAARRL